MKFWLLFAVLVLNMFVTFANTIVPGGRVSGRWSLAGSPYIVIGNVFVEDSLIIDPGVNVRFDGGWQIEIRSNARFLARGTAVARIVFEPHIGSGGGLWNRIFLNGSGGNDTLDNCVIRYGTDGIYSEDSKPFISECTIYGNRGAADHGYGIFLSFYRINSKETKVVNCRVYDNSVGIGLLAYGLAGQWYPSDTATIDRCVVYKNLSHGIYVVTSSNATWASGVMLARISNSTICNNRGSGVHAFTPDGRGVARTYVINSVIAFNGNYGCVRQDYAGVLWSDIRYNCFWQNRLGHFSGISGTDFGPPPRYLNRNSDSCDISRNLYFDPQFVDTTTANYYLLRTSRCIDAGTDAGFEQVFLDPDSTIPDIGAHYFQHVRGINFLSPVPNQLIAADSARFIWNCRFPTVAHYSILVAADSLFRNVRFNATLTDTTVLFRSFTNGNYWWKVRAMNDSSMSKFRVDIPTGVEATNRPLSTYALFQNYPNPFNPTTRIRFSIHSSQDVSLKIYDLLGREVATLVNKGLQPGNHETTFDGSGLASGVYLYRLHAGQFTATKNLLLVR